MKLEKGVTVSIGKEKFTGEIPDNIAKKAGLIKEPRKEADKK